MNSNRTFYIVADILLLFLIAALTALVMNKDIQPPRALKEKLTAVKYKVIAVALKALNLKSVLPAVPGSAAAGAPAVSYLRLEASVLIDAKRRHVFLPELYPVGREPQTGHTTLWQEPGSAGFSL